MSVTIPKLNQKTKFIIITGGVVSGIGKGVAAASIGRLLKNNFKIIPIKCDGYLNTDPGTMNPIEHGEVFVLDDGGEVDMDFGHYERYLGINAKSSWNITMGKVYKTILENERQGLYLGKTVQLIPHVTEEIKRRIYQIANEETAELILLEIGGTIGDMENELFVETVRQIRSELGHESLMFMHLTYVPIVSGSNEQKSKPTQQSVKILNQSGIYPDVVIGRCEEVITDSIKEKISLHCNIPSQSVISGIDVNTIYELPLIFEEQFLSQLIEKRINVTTSPTSENYGKLVKVIKNNLSSPASAISIALCGKYTDLEDSYASISEALIHCMAHNNVKIEQVMIETSDINKDNVKEKLKDIDGIIIPGGFGSRGVEGKIEVIRHLRENNIPFLGICLGMQLAVVEFARNICGIKGANTTETEQGQAKVKEPVIDILPEQINVSAKGGTMRLGGYDVQIRSKTKTCDFYRATLVRERFRHRYEVNPSYVEQLEKHGLVFSGMATGQNIMQIVELPDKDFFIGCQFHPELISRLESPAVLFNHFIKAIIKKTEL